MGQPLASGCVNSMTIHSFPVANRKCTMQNFISLLLLARESYAICDKYLLNGKKIVKSEILLYSLMLCILLYSA